MVPFRSPANYLRGLLYVIALLIQVPQVEYTPAGRALKYFSCRAGGKRHKHQQSRTEQGEEQGSHWRLLEPLERVDSSLFLCKMEDVPATLRLHGLAVIQDDELGLLTSDEAASAATAFIQKAGRPIFQHVLRDAEGDIASSEEGRPYLTGSGGERVQARVRSSTAPGPLITIQRRGEAIVKRVVDLIQAQKPTPRLKVFQRSGSGTSPCS